jgi:Arc/MetJ-type ribon-helix-helix transcriptional regulator
MFDSEITEIRCLGVMMTESVEKKSVLIPIDLYQRIEEAVKQSAEFDSIDNYVTFIMEEILREEDEKLTFTEEEEKAIKERLKALGYMD